MGDKSNRREEEKKGMEKKTIRCSGKMEIGGAFCPREMEESDINKCYSVLAKWAKEILPVTDPKGIRGQACLRIIREDVKRNGFPFAEIAQG